MKRGRSRDFVWDRRIKNSQCWTMSTRCHLYLIIRKTSTSWKESNHLICLFRNFPPLNQAKSTKIVGVKNEKSCIFYYLLSNVLCILNLIHWIFFQQLYCHILFAYPTSNIQEWNRIIGYLFDVWVVLINFSKQ